MERVAGALEDVDWGAAREGLVLFEELGVDLAKRGGLVATPSIVLHCTWHTPSAHKIPHARKVMAGQRLQGVLIETTLIG